MEKHKAWRQRNDLSASPKRSGELPNALSLNTERRKLWALVNRKDRN
ncbi:MAG: hypothetical protein LBO67_04120 [Spirochaetaceae bacterium]|nr:hypothetical protein [Spirochaetaceae bacterium]